MHNPIDDFILENGELKQYIGPYGDVVIPPGVTRIGRNAFRFRSGVTGIAIPASVTEIGPQAFQDCHELTEITLPDGVVRIPERAFAGCRKLTRITLPDSVAFIDAAAFQHCGSLTEIHMPSGVLYIGPDAFSECTQLTHIALPDGVTYIGERAFYSCRKLTSLAFPPCVTQIADEICGHCIALESLTLPDGVIKIGAGAFESCVSLTAAMLPDSVRSVGASAFRGCTHLAQVALPDRMTTIGDEAFVWCDRLKEITVPSGVTRFGKNVFLLFFGDEGPVVRWRAQCPLPDDVVAVAGYLIAPEVMQRDFADAACRFKALRGFLHANDEYTDPAIRADYMRSALRQRKKLLPEVFREDLVSALMLYAEQGKITAENIEAEYMIPAQEAQATGCMTFLLDWSDKHIVPEEIEKQLEKALTKDPYNAADMKKQWAYKVQEDGTVMLTAYKGSEEEVLVPERIGKRSVTALGDNVFSVYAERLVPKTKARAGAMTKLRVIVLPGSVTTIGNAAFHGCTGLTRIYIPDSVTNIGEDVCFGCAQLTIAAPAGSFAAAYARAHNIPVAAE